MGIQIISISHKTAPLAVREKFSYTKEQQESMMKEIVAHPDIDECIVLSTCNRTEMYVYSPTEVQGRVFQEMQDVLLKEAGAQDDEEIGDYLLFYTGNGATRHMFRVTAGLDSMVIGEDQILGQVKDAHKQAREIGTTGVYLNTFSRMAVTAAKKVKTETELSKTSVSTATLSLKVAEEKLGTLKGKKVMIVGASGKIGGIVLMNLLSMGVAEVYVTARNHKVVTTKHVSSDFTTIEYTDRYDYVDDMDVIISATASPHYVFTYSKIKNAIKTEKPRVFVDLAVPIDIEARVKTLGESFYYNIDDFTKIAEENNRRKLQEAEVANEILEDYERQFEQWMVFQKSLPVMGEVRDNFMKVAEHKGVEKAFDHFFYWVRENNDPEDLEVFFQCLKH